MKFDLHIHSCLSPCASLEMAPSEIVSRAAIAGMDGIALTDHQSARNVPAIAECARRAGLKCLFGLEVQTAEEVHTLAIFDTPEQALAMTDWVYAALPKRVNDPDTFGDQPVVTADNDIVEMEWRILAMGCRRNIPETSEKTRELGGLYIAAHIDRPNYSVVSGLGAVPEGCFDAVELSRTADETAWLPRSGGLAAVRSSDAHNPEDVARVWTEADISDFSVSALKQAFASRATRLSPRLTSF
ncbi:MAG: PHP domain-containing protein [Kiritimatiellae bacterium]|nr:PHP domain-containing protein [Kiritimatiellia bacterium]